MTSNNDKLEGVQVCSLAYLHVKIKPGENNVACFVKTRIVILFKEIDKKI